MSSSSPHRAAPPETLDDDPPVADLMTSRIIGITPDAPLQTALHLMASTGVRHLPVLHGTRCRGMVTELDLTGFVAEGLAAGLVVCADLARPVGMLPPSARRSDAARRMRAARIDAVLVADHGRLLGVVTATDLVRSLAEERPARGEG
ncbi:hypothetical protein BJF78_30230 [Pseudonocardia sp. CNS-139]|nr:hypothetical protein BJF78_30230 [Pseudonocardia sp. CNS-139]